MAPRSSDEHSEPLFAVFGSNRSDGNDVQGSNGIDVTVFTDDADFMRSDQDELGMWHVVFPAIGSANGERTKSTAELSPNLRNIHRCFLPQTISTVKSRFV